MQKTVLTLIALLALAMTGCATRELRCNGALEPINAAPSTARAVHAGDEHGR